MAQIAWRLSALGEMRGDDAAGIEVVRRLRHKLKSSKVLLVEGGVAPENFTSNIRRFKPSHVIFIDATDFGAEHWVVSSLNFMVSLARSFSSRARR